MPDAIRGIWAWLAPIAAGFLTLAGQLWLNQRFKRADEKRDQARADTDAKRAAEAEWRECIEQRLDKQDEKIDSVLKGQCTQMRSDIVHKAHRYLDDLGMASTEEKQAFWVEYEDYQLICEQYGIENHFVDELAKRVMELPEREV